jgi:hypothetical protein
MLKQVQHDEPRERLDAALFQNRGAPGSELGLDFLIAMSRRGSARA